MKVYPKGCRWFVIKKGTIGARQKTTQRRAIDDGWWASADYVVVQPRGHLQWYLFDRRPKPPRLVAKGKSYRALCMAAVLRN